MTNTSDTAAIEALLEGALRHICWNSQTSPDWDSFLGPYLDDAVMIPSARPAQVVFADAFKAGMDAQRLGGELADLQERPLATIVRVFGTVAIAQSSFAMRINQSDVEGYGVNSYLLVKSDGAWRIAGVAWDNAADQNSLPKDLQGVTIAAA